MSAGTSISGVDTDEFGEADSPQAARRRLYSVICELVLLVSCFVLAVYSTRLEPRHRRQPPASTPAQQTKTPLEIAPPVSDPPPPVGKSLARVG